MNLRELCTGFVLRAPLGQGFPGDREKRTERYL